MKNSCKVVPSLPNVWKYGSSTLRRDVHSSVTKGQISKTAKERYVIIKDKTYRNLAGQNFCPLMNKDSNAQVLHSNCQKSHFAQVRRYSNFYHGPEYGRHSFLSDDEITDEMATKILRQHEMSVTIKEDFDNKNINPVASFESNILPSNTPLEDRRAQAKFHHNTDLGMLFGVFDGHGGHQCANAVSNRLFQYMALALLPHKDLEPVLQDLDNGKAWPALLEWYQHTKLPPGVALRPHQAARLRRFMEKRLNEEIVVNNVEDAMYHSCRALDTDILNDAKQQTVYRNLKHASADLAAIDTAMSGCVACFTHISQDIITVGNLGDSRAVLGTRDILSPGRWIATPLSNKHNAQNEEEVARILSEHPAHEKDAVIRNERLLGSLAPLRAFGNARFKWPTDLINEISTLSQDGEEGIGVGGDYRIPDTSNWVLPYYRSPPYLSSEPDVISHQLQPNDAFLIVATDGLWETMHKRNVIQIVGEHIDRTEGRTDVKDSNLLSESDILDTDAAFFGFEDTNAATNIIRHCIGQTFDGSSRRQVRSMLTLSKEESRFYRDDITVTVIKFNKFATC